MPLDAIASDAWDAALDRYRGMTGLPAHFNVGLMEWLRPQWQARVRPDTSMLDVLFTRYGSNGYTYEERVEVQFKGKDRVRVALVRQAPRRGESRPAGPVVVTGDYVRPENAGPVVESFLLQLADETCVASPGTA